MDINKFATTLRTPSWKRSLYFRRTLALLLLAAAAFSGWATTIHKDPRYVVAVRELQPGATITDSDIGLRAVPEPLQIPDAFSDPALISGKTVAHPLKSGELLSSRDVMSQELADAMSNSSPHGEAFALVPVKLADPASASLMHPGVPVSIVTARDDLTATPTVIAENARVVFGTAVEANKLSAGTVLVALPHRDAQAVAAASLHHPLAVVVNSQR